MRVDGAAGVLAPVAVVYKIIHPLFQEFPLGR
jgi:hypothetical protein